nr:MAG TPA: hypothetical protein [Caudoviricetes sp.]
MLYLIIVCVYGQKFLLLIQHLKLLMRLLIGILLKRLLKQAMYKGIICK